LEAVILLIGVALVVVAAYGDVRTLRIPNLLVAAVGALGVLRLIVIGDPSVALYTAGASAAVFVTAFVLFWLRLIGGGDAKLIAATALLVGYNELLNFLLLMSICGALLALAILLTHPSSDSSPSKTRLPVPYGVAIAAGGVVTLLFQPCLFG
jgi:prepilin peptidase CpaA